MPLFDFRAPAAGRAGRAAPAVGAASLREDALAFDDELDEPQGSMRPAPARPAGAGASSGRKRARVFDFGDSDDDEQPDAAARSSARGSSLVLGSPEESSLTPESQKSHPSRPRSEQRLGAAHGSAVVSAHGGGSSQQPTAPASVVERIWQQSSAGAQRVRGACALDGLDELEQPEAPRGRAFVREHAAAQSLARKPAGGRMNGDTAAPSPKALLQAMQPPAAHRAGKSSIDRIWNELENATDAGAARQHGARAGSKENHHSQMGQLRLGLCERGSQHGQSIVSQQNARDAWKEKDASSASQREAYSAEDHARKILLSPLQAAPRQVPASQRSCARRADVEIVEPEPHDVGWGAEIARARGGRGAGMRDGRGEAGMSDARMVDDASFAQDEHRPCVPGPAGKLGRAEAGAGRSDGRASPVLREQCNEEEGASREERVGIAVDANGPQLPLRKKYLVGPLSSHLRAELDTPLVRVRSCLWRIADPLSSCPPPPPPRVQAIDPHDADFTAKSWRKMLSDLDIEPFTGHTRPCLTLSSLPPRTHTPRGQNPSSGTLRARLTCCVSAYSHRTSSNDGHGKEPPACLHCCFSHAAELRQEGLFPLPPATAQRGLQTFEQGIHYTAHTLFFEGMREWAFRHFTLIAARQVPRLLVFVKTLSMEDECASATIKDPTGTRAAARCPCALARCRTPAVPSALETLRGDMAYVNPNR